MFSVLRKFSKLFSIFTKPVYILWTIICFCIRYLFLGVDNALKYLSSISKFSIIPILKLYGANIGKKCDIQSGITFHNCNNFSNLVIGENCHIGKNCFFDLRSKVFIGNNVVISMKTTIVTHQDLNKSSLSMIYPEECKEVIIKDNCYIGVNSTILKGVTINHSSIVAACSLVNKNIPSGVLVAGVPSKEIKKIDGV